MDSYNLYLLLIVPALLAWFAQARVRAVYKKYEATPNHRRISGVEAARSLLASHGLSNVTIEPTQGHLTDHYDPQAKTLRLSDGVADGDSVTSLGIVAHEVGHAAQDAEGYRFMQVRSTLANRLGRAAQWSSFLFIGAMLFQVPILMVAIGVFMAGTVLFALVTLPVERNASDRALKDLTRMGMAVEEEREGVRRVLRAAAFTYVAGLSQRLGTLLFFVAAIGAARSLV